jgi:uncharacterized membrane protein
MQYLMRFIIAAVVFVVLSLVLPALFTLLGVPLTGNLLTIFKGVGALLALGYILWGPPVPRPGS